MFPAGPSRSRTTSSLAAGCCAKPPFFPLGASPHQVALAWLLQRSPAIVLIPGTSSVAHLRENVAAADLVLPPDAVAGLDTVGG